MPLQVTTVWPDNWQQKEDSLAGSGSRISQTERTANALGSKEGTGLTALRDGLEQSQVREGSTIRRSRADPVMFPMYWDGIAPYYPVSLPLFSVSEADHVALRPKA